VKSTDEKLVKISKIIEGLGFSLDEKQPHIGGERYLMTGNKLVLIGRQNATNIKVVLKVSSHPLGKKEIEREKQARDILLSLAFANNTIFFPKELYFGQSGSHLIWVTQFIEQDKVFVARPIEEQFFTVLGAFEAQESFHATTYEHIREVRDFFPIYSSKKYLDDFKKFGTAQIFIQAEKFLNAHSTTIDRYANHLVHTDFVPHNFRVNNHQVYMLDCSSVYFGNKYEGWARFLNYMLIHNPNLEQLLSKYIRENRGEDEYLSLRLMRIYKIGYLLDYYATSIAKTTGDLHTLTALRIDFWGKAMKAILDDAPLERNMLKEYLINRDRLRSPEEKERQKEFAIA